MNKLMSAKNPYLLIGPGRWGSSDSWLGIPVTWEQISGAKSIIETTIEGLNADPSFGSHFFQNLTSLRIGYFTLEKKMYQKNIDWIWLKDQNHLYKSNLINVISLNEPLLIKLDGVKGEGIILKQKSNDNNTMNEEETSGI